MGVVVLTWLLATFMCLTLGANVTALVTARRNLRLREAYRLVLEHGREHFDDALVALAATEEAAQVEALPEAYAGWLQGPEVQPVEGPLHAPRGSALDREALETLSLLRPAE